MVPICRAFQVLRVLQLVALEEPKCGESDYMHSVKQVYAFYADSTASVFIPYQGQCAEGWDGRKGTGMDN